MIICLPYTSINVTCMFTYLVYCQSGRFAARQTSPLGQSDVDFQAKAFGFVTCRRTMSSDAGGTSCHYVIMNGNLATWVSSLILRLCVYWNGYDEILIRFPQLHVSFDL